MSDLLGVLQQIMQENQQAMKPTELAFGTVVSVGPLSILVDNTAEPKPEAGLILTDSVVARSARSRGEAAAQSLSTRGLPRETVW